MRSSGQKISQRGGKNRNSKKRVSIHSSPLLVEKVDAGHTNKNNEIRIAVAIIDLFPIHFKYFFFHETSFN